MQDATAQTQKVRDDVAMLEAGAVVVDWPLDILQLPTGAAGAIDGLTVVQVLSESEMLVTIWHQKAPRMVVRQYTGGSLPPSSTPTLTPQQIQDRDRDRENRVTAQVMIRGVDTSDLADRQDLNLSEPLVVTGTYEYVTQDGRGAAVPLLTKLDFSVYTNEKQAKARLVVPED